MMSIIERLKHSILVMSGGVSENTWKKMSGSEKRNYVKEHPNSKWADVHKQEQNNKKVDKIKDKIKELKELRSKYKRKSNLDKIDAQIKKLRDKAKALNVNTIRHKVIEEVKENKVPSNKTITSQNNTPNTNTKPHYTYSEAKNLTGLNFEDGYDKESVKNIMKKIMLPFKVKALPNSFNSSVDLMESVENVVRSKFPGKKADDYLDWFFTDMNAKQINNENRIYNLDKVKTHLNELRKDVVRDWVKKGLCKKVA